MTKKPEIAEGLKVFENMCRKSAVFLHANAGKAKTSAKKEKVSAVFLPHKCKSLKTSLNVFCGGPDRRLRRTWGTKHVSGIVLGKK